MYTAIGIYPPHSPHSDRSEASLEFATLDEALQKLRDWAEADEIDEAPMFTRYALTTPRSVAAAEPPHPPADDPDAGFRLRLVQ